MPIKSYFIVFFILLLPSTSFADNTDTLSRIEQIVLTGKYKKSVDFSPPKKLILKTNKNETVAKKEQSKSNVKTKKKKTKKRYQCLGGSYKAFNKKAKKYDKSITKYSQKYDVPKSLIKSIIIAESCFQEKAVSPKGAQGLMQLMPATAKRFGVSNSFNPDSNIKGGTRYLQFLLKHFDEDLLHTIAAYNAGEGAVAKYNGIPPYKETKNYVSKVASLYKLFSQGGGVLSVSSFKDNKALAISIFKPRAMPRSQFSPYKGRIRNISHGNCANRTSTRLKNSTSIQSGQGVWQRIYSVRRGDTLSRVTQKTGIHKSKIMQMNGLRSRSKLKQGQTLLIWECRKSLR
jgi:LysM repeat protein